MDKEIELLVEEIFVNSKDNLKEVLMRAFLMGMEYKAKQDFKSNKKSDE